MFNKYLNSKKKSIGMYVSDKDLDEKFKKADLNQDQTITADELHKFFHGKK